MPSTQASSSNSFGVNVIITYHILSLLIWIALQTLSFYEFREFAHWGLPNTNECHLDGMTINSGAPLGTTALAVGFADLILMIPMTLWAALGLGTMEFYGTCASIVVFGIGIYRGLEIFWMSLMNNELVTREYIPIAERAFLYANLLISIMGIWYHWMHNKSTFKKVRGSA